MTISVDMRSSTYHTRALNLYSSVNRNRNTCTNFLMMILEFFNESACKSRNRYNILNMPIFPFIAIRHDSYGWTIADVK